MGIVSHSLIVFPFSSFIFSSIIAMKFQISALALIASLVLVSAEEAAKPVEAKEDTQSAATEKKQDKRGIFDFGYGGQLGGGHELSLGSGLELGGHGLEGHHEHVKHVTITKTVKVPVPAPYPVHVEKKVPVPVPYPVKVPVDRPYPVHVPKPYPVEVVKHVPYPVEKHVPYPVKVPVKVPYPVKVEVKVPHPVPYPVEKHVPYPVKVPVYIEKKVPVYIKEHHHEPIVHDFGGHGLDIHSGFH